MRIFFSPKAVLNIILIYAAFSLLSNPDLRVGIFQRFSGAFAYGNFVESILDNAGNFDVGSLVHGEGISRNQDDVPFGFERSKSGHAYSWTYGSKPVSHPHNMHCDSRSICTFSSTVNTPETIAPFKESFGSNTQQKERR